jgi:integrase
MIQDRVLKIIRGLSSFTLDDIITMTGFDESEISKTLFKLIKEGFVIKMSNNGYAFVNKIPARESTIRLLEKSGIQTILHNNIMFKQAAEYFLLNHALKNCSPTTFKTYKSLVKHHLSPFFGKIEIKDITEVHIKEFIELKSREQLADKRLNSCITLFGNMFKKFMEWELISDSPYSGIINVKFSRKQQIKIMTSLEVDKLLKTVKDNYSSLYMPILLILSTGIKKAELLALKKEDIDLKNRKIYINKTLFEGKILVPKPQTVIRQVDIPEKIIAELKKVIKNKKTKHFAFYDDRQSWFTQDKYMRIHFSKLVNKSGIERITLNDLRHTYAYNALQAGMSIDYLHKQLGDYSIQATMDKYRDFIV